MTEYLKNMNPCPSCGSREYLKMDRDIFFVCIYCENGQYDGEHIVSECYHSGRAVQIDKECESQIKEIDYLKAEKKAIQEWNK